LSEAYFWGAYFSAFIATLALGLGLKRRLWLISLATAALASAALAILSAWRGDDTTDPWFQIGIVINFGMSWCFAAAAVYVVKVIRA
jgi:hypothetical protein